MTASEKTNIVANSKIEKIKKVYQSILLILEIFWKRNNNKVYIRANVVESKCMLVGNYINVGGKIFWFMEQ